MCEVSLSPITLFDDVIFRLIVNYLGKYIDNSEPKDGLFAYASICVEICLEKRLPVEVQLCMDTWSHIQEVDYD